MAAGEKKRRATLAPRPAPVATNRADVEASPVAPAPPRVRRDTRSSEEVAALYVRLPATTKRRLDVAAAMTGRNLSDVIAALLEQHVDPTDTRKQAALERLLRGA
jgi:predicted DNA-binding protein